MNGLLQRPVGALAGALRRASEIFLAQNRLVFFPGRGQVGFMHAGLRFKFRHGWVNPHPDERGVLAFVRPDPDTIQAGTRHGILTIKEIKHDPPPVNPHASPPGFSASFGENHLREGIPCRGIGASRSLGFKSAGASGSWNHISVCYARSGPGTGRRELPGGSGSGMENSMVSVFLSGCCVQAPSGDTIPL